MVKSKQNCISNFKTDSMKALSIKQPWAGLIAHVHREPHLDEAAL
jgi:hypothetical protein